MKGIAQIDVAGFIADYTRSRYWTARIVREFEDKDLALEPGPGSMTTAAQVLQIRQCDNFMLSVLGDDVPTHEAFNKEFDVSSIEACLASLKTGLAEVTALAKTLSADKWKEEVSPFGPEWTLSRGQMSYLMIDHEAHHRGQLTVYLRVAGKTPPVLFAPVDETIFEKNGQP